MIDMSARLQEIKFPLRQQEAGININVMNCKINLKLEKRAYYKGKNIQDCGKGKTCW